MCEGSLEKTPMENTDNKWAYEKGYGKILAATAATAIREIESQTGHKVLSLTIPKPACYDDPTKQQAIFVRLSFREKESGKAQCHFQGMGKCIYYVGDEDMGFGEQDSADDSAHS